MHNTLTAWITLATITIYFWMGMNAARARVKHGIKAPVMDGPIEFMSVHRVLANTLEQMAVFLPALWMCAVFLGDAWAAAGGALWCVGRVLYALGYYQDPSRRTLGFTMSFSATILLMLGTAVGILMH
ncbi:MAG: MAPEG family protein [Pseudomonadota bacterium]